MTENKHSIPSRIIAIIFSIVITISLSFIALPEYVNASSAGGSVKADSYDMDLELDTQTQTINETVVLKITNKTNSVLSSICLRDFAPAIIAYDKAKKLGDTTINSNKSSEITSIKNTASDVELVPTYKQKNSVIYVKLDSPLAQGESMSLTIKCKTGIPEREDRFGYYSNKSGTIYDLSLCFPTLSMYKNGKWNENPYFDSGESRCAECTDYSVRLTAPENYTVAATGNESSTSLNGIKTTSITGKSIRDFAIVACDYMNKDTNTVNGIKINNYYFNTAQTDTYRKYSMDAACDSVRMFTKKFGKYPYDELDVTPAYFGGNGNGMEYPGLVMIDASDFLTKKSDKAAYATQLASTVTHEVGHEWFFASVGDDEYSEAWLDEGFATYCEYTIYSTTYSKSLSEASKHDGMPSSKKSLNSSKEYNKNMIYEINSSPKKCGINRPYNVLGYHYGLYVYSFGNDFLWQLKHVMGSKKFTAATKEYYSKYTEKIATTKGFLKIIRKYNNSKKINKVINRYISKKYL